MEEMMTQMPETGAVEEISPIQSVISTVDSYIQNPASVTPETLMSLKEQLMAIQADVEGEDAPEGTGMSDEIMKAGRGME